MFRSYGLLLCFIATCSIHLIAPAKATAFTAVPIIDPEKPAWLLSFLPWMAVADWLPAKHSVIQAYVLPW